jgi:MinD-like ATPase involved in chromosome partitioning or flagellar assembly
MTLVAVVGDCATTTTVALAAAWPADDDVVVLEVDPRGGSLAAWLDLPASPTLSTAVTLAPDGDWSVIEPLVRTAPAGLRVLPAPARAVEAARAVAEASMSLLQQLAARAEPIAIADCGDVPAAEVLPVAVTSARAVVVAHRQSPHSARAEAVRLQRRADLVTRLADTGAEIVLAVVGTRPFTPHDVVAFVADGVDVSWTAIPDDALTAAVIAGRVGVSARRLARLPLSRGATRLATVVRHALLREATERAPSARGA